MQVPGLFLYGRRVIRPIETVGVEPTAKNIQNRILLATSYVSTNTYEKNLFRGPTLCRQLG